MFLFLYSFLNMLNSHSYGSFVLPLLYVVPSYIWTPISLISPSMSIMKLDSLVSSQWLIVIDKVQGNVFE